jgi:exonuclease III
MTNMKIMSLNGENMVDLIPETLNIPGEDSSHYWRAKLLAAMIQEVNPDILGLVEAPPYQIRTRKFVDNFLGGSYTVYQGEKRGLYGLAILVRNELEIDVNVHSKEQSLKDFKLGAFDADEDGIKENYSWWNRVPLEAEFSGEGLKDKTNFILIHAKSKGAFIPGDLFAYDRLSRANRMKLKAQANAVRKRLDKLIDEDGKGRVVVMGDMNDSPKFDVYFAMLGGAFLEPVMGSVWDPVRIMHNCHATIKKGDRWTIDFKDRVVNPLDRSRFGQPAELRSWIDHILVSPQLKDSVVPKSFGILHKQPRVEGLPKKHWGMRGSDHHPPYVTLDI